METSASTPGPRVCPEAPPLPSCTRLELSLSRDEGRVLDSDIEKGQICFRIEVQASICMHRSDAGVLHLNPVRSYWTGLNCLRVYFVQLAHSTSSHNLQQSSRKGALRSLVLMLSPEQRKQASRKLTHWLDNEKKIVSWMSLKDISIWG